MLIFKFSIGPECHMLHNVRSLVDVFIFYVAITGAELELKAHDSSTGNVY